MFCLWEVTNNATGLRERNSIARVINSSADRNSTELEPLCGVNGQVVPSFPATLGDAKALNGERLTFCEGGSDLNQVI